MNNKLWYLKNTITRAKIVRKDGSFYSSEEEAQEELEKLCRLNINVDNLKVASIGIVKREDDYLSIK